jgi:hypothetical protein
VAVPRLNATWEVAKGWWLRGGYGLTAKMPTLSYLYPGPRFYDLVNFNYFAPNPAERLVVITTRRIEPDTRQLRPYRAQKWEAGLDWQWAGSTGAITYFRDFTPNGYQFVRLLTPLPYQRLRAQSTPAGRPPVLSPVPASNDTLLAAYDVPVNNLRVQNRGVEFNIDIPEWPLIRTSFNITGAWVATRSTSEGAFLDADRAVFNTQTTGRVPVYPAGQGTEARRFNTSVRLVHRIPALKFIFSALVQTIWVESSRQVGLEVLPTGYVNRGLGYVELSPAQAEGQPFADLRRLVNPLSMAWQHRPPLWLFNFRLTKEWQPGRGFAFYVNNFFANRPLFTSILNNALVQRNQPNLFFGAEVYFQW